MALILGVIGVLLAATTIRGAVIIDEINYMVTVTGLERGTLTVPYTGSLMPSSELFYFDPESYGRIATSTPVVSLAPPLYAPIALPFILLGWRGLAFLNTLAFLLAALLVFLLVKRLASERATPWMAIAFFVLGGFSLEYSQGVWPHMLSVFLCLASVFFIVAAWEKSRLFHFLIAGIFIGLASGVREQNVFLVFCIGLVVLLWSDQRLLSAASYVCGVAIPFSVASLLNYFRFGTLQPVPKSAGYVQMISHPATAEHWLRPFEAFLVKVVDFSFFALFKDPKDFVDYAWEPLSGSFLVAGTVKKALLQSSPWMLLAIVCCFVAWRELPRRESLTSKAKLAFSLLIVLTLAAFSFAGFRMDGLSFNQRYLLEIVPLAAMLLALCIEGSRLSWHRSVVGILLASATFTLLLATTPLQVQHVAISHVPLLLGLGALAGWIFRRSNAGKQILEISLGLCVGWSLMVQIADLAVSRSIRSTNAVIMDSLQATIPDHSALFAFWGAQKAAAGPLQLKKDVVILDAWADNGTDAGPLTRELLQQGRKVFLYGQGIPTNIVHNIQGSDSLAVVMTKPVLLYEVTGREKTLNQRNRSSESSRDNPPRERTKR